MLDSFRKVGGSCFVIVNFNFLLLLAGDCYRLVLIVALIQIYEHLVKTSKSIFNIA